VEEEVLVERGGDCVESQTISGVTKTIQVIKLT